MAVELYGAGIDDVDSFLIWNVRDSTDPTRPAIEKWLEVGAAELAGLVGDIPAEGTCGGDAWRTRARFIIALYAAAMAEDAHYPERATDRDAGDYGARLWERHKEQTARLQTDIEACRDGLNPGSAHGGAGHTFPSPPMAARLMPS